MDSAACSGLSTLRVRAKRRSHANIVCIVSGSGTAVKGEHIRDPQSGNAARAIAAWVKSPTAAWTDAISTALMIIPREAATKFCKSHTDIAAVIIYPGKEAPEAIVTGQW